MLLLSLLLAFFAPLLTFDGGCRLEQLVISHQIVVGSVQHIAHIVRINRREDLGMAECRIWGHGHTCAHLFGYLRDLRVQS
jgi:hypothetical protein